MQRRSDLECDKIILVIVRSRPFQTVGYLALVEVVASRGAPEQQHRRGPDTHGQLNIRTHYIAQCTYITIEVSVTFARRRQHVQTTIVQTSRLSSIKARYTLVTNHDYETRPCAAGPRADLGIGRYTCLR